MMANELDGKRIAFLAADGVEKVELEQPRAALEQAGARTEVLSLKAGEIQARDHDLDPAGTVAVDRTVADAAVAEYDGLILPGGTVNPDKLRMDKSAVSFVREFVESGRGRCGGGPDADLVFEYSHRPSQCGCSRRRRGSRR
jgi:protease I